jgi:hypothetical protein
MVFDHSQFFQAPQGRTGALIATLNVGFHIRSVLASLHDPSRVDAALLGTDPRMVTTASRPCGQMMRDGSG